MVWNLHSSLQTCRRWYGILSIPPPDLTTPRCRLPLYCKKLKHNAPRTPVVGFSTTVIIYRINHHEVPSPDSSSDVRLAGSGESRSQGERAAWISLNFLDPNFFSAWSLIWSCGSWNTPSENRNRQVDSQIVTISRILAYLLVINNDAVVSVIFFHTDSLPRKTLMDNNHPLHLPRMLPNPNLRCPIGQIIGPILLDACYPCIEPWNTHGAWHLTNCHLRTCYAIARRKSNYWG